MKKLRTETLGAACAVLCLCASVAAQTRGPVWLILPLSVLPFAVWGLFDDVQALAWHLRALFADAAGIIVAGGVLLANIWHEHNAILYLGVYGNKLLALENSLMLLMFWLIGYFLIDAAKLLRGRKMPQQPDDRAQHAAETPAETPAAADAKSARGGVLLGLLASLFAVALIALISERMGFASQESAVRIVYAYLTDGTHILNIYIGISLCAVCFCLLGKGIGACLSALMLLFVAAANIIKLKYHGTFFTWLDLLQLKDGILFAREMLTPAIIAAIVAALVVVIAAIVKWRRPIGHALRPRLYILLLVSTGMCATFFIALTLQDKWRSMEVYQRTWENEAVNVQCNGLLVNMLYNLRTLGEINMEKPDGYSEESAEAIAEEFDSLYPDTTDDVRPDVILVLAESLFDLDGVDGITFSEDIDSTIDAYSPATMISPRYGGYTSAIEFEALTGLSLAYMPNGLTPFTTYFNNPDDVFPSIAREFQNSGYLTKAMHPDLPDFYNRTVVYQNMGFDEYLSIGSFTLTEENTTKNGWLKDEPFGEMIIEQLEDSDTPQFIFAITYEGHYVNVDKYDETEIKASSDLLSDELLHQVEQQAQAYYDTDKMIAELIDYIDNTDRPTLLYVFGDHLPPLDALGELGYTSDIYRKYGTCLVMYGNYKTPEVEPDYITPNQIAAQIMMDSGIEHSSYYDYIYSLRDSYPVLHKEFVEVEDNPDLEDYYYLQYDILMGEHYLYEK